MKNNKAYTWGIRGLSLIVFFRLLLLLFLSYQTRNIGTFVYKMPAIRIFTWLEIAVMLLVILEAVTYGVLKNKIQAKAWIRLHVWSLFFVMFFIPLLMMGLIMIGLLYIDKSELKELMPRINTVRYYLAWALTITGHGAFIIVLIKSLSIKNETGAVETPSGILDEFTSE
ncbi:hypothetical protein [Ferruginibacter sp. SUN106]|uniref:hypothetical protein n=1 Tax=Ferruginibacter sp. SUN106 TaxID=2978348 RepID=UPI003D36F476